MTDAILEARCLAKSFTLHLQGGAVIPVLHGLDLRLRPGECLALVGRSGMGKSTLMKLLYGTYLAAPGGSVRVLHGGRWVELVGAEPRQVIEVRRRTLGYVSQFLRVVPRVPAIDVVAEPLLVLGADREEARARAGTLLARLNLPERLWGLPPATFSGGEQQRVNIARGLVHPYPVLLLDEPTASLDEANRAVVIGLIDEAKARGTAMIGIFHDEDVRNRVATRRLDLSPPARAAA